MVNPVYTDAFASDFIPPLLWGKDHWTTLLYLASLAVDFEIRVGYDPRMRHNRRHFRVMIAENPRPPQRNGDKSAPHMGHAPMREEHSTRLNNGKLARGHDDWNCVQDMAAIDLFTIDAAKVDVKAKLQFSARGWLWINAVQKFCAAGGRAGQFDPVEAGLCDGKGNIPTAPKTVDMAGAQT